MKYFKRHWLHMQLPSFKPKPEKNLAPRSNQPRYQHHRSWHAISGVEWEGQCSSKATPCLSPRELANFGKLLMASMWDGLEFKSHLGGHGNTAHYNRGVLHGAKALTSNRMLPRCGKEGLPRLDLKQ